MRSLDRCWKIMLDPSEPTDLRAECEAEVRELAMRGLVPPNMQGKLDPTFVLDLCREMREDIGVRVGPQPVRFTDEELLFVIGAINAVETDRPMAEGILARLRHREKTMRNERNREDRHAVSLSEATPVHARQASKDRGPLGQEVRRQDRAQQEEVVG